MTAKRVLKWILLVLIFIGPSISYGASSTPNIGLTKPDDGDTGWGNTLRENWDKIDAQSVQKCGVAEVIVGNLTCTTPGSGGGTECSSSACDLHTDTELNSQGICLADGTDCPAAGAGDLLADGTVPLTDNWDVGNFDMTMKSLTADGTVEGATVTEGGNAVWNETETDIIDSQHYVANSIDDEHLNTTDWIDLPVKGAKRTGTFITLPARVDAGDPLWRLLFAAGQTEEALFHFTAPTGCCASAVAKITYSHAEDCSIEKVDWEIKIMAVADGESMTSASFDTLNEIIGATACPATADLRDTVSLTLTNFDSGTAGETIVVHVQRDHDDGDDNASGDAQLHELNIEWTR